MKREEFQTLDPIADELAEQAAKWVQSVDMLGFRQRLRQAVDDLPDSYAVEVAVELRVFDEKRGKTVRLLSAGLSAFPGREPHEVSGDSSPHRYIVDGEMCQVPHDHCPDCWGIWDFKLDHPVCPDCGCRMGREVKLLLDTDTCPRCEEGHVSINNPVCPQCGFRVDPSIIVWG